MHTEWIAFSAKGDEWLASLKPPIRAFCLRYQKSGALIPVDQRARGPSNRVNDVASLRVNPAQFKLT
jgi:hypothetical protein